MQREASPIPESGAPRRRSRRGPAFTPVLALVALAFLGAIVLERTGSLPVPVAGRVREAEERLLIPLVERLDIRAPEREASGGPDVAPDATLDVAEARAMLATIPVVPECQDGFAREDWPHWPDLDGDCRDARQEALSEESLEPAKLSEGGCRVTAGRWLDGFTGETVTDPSRLDVIHLVPLEEAHESGGHAWDGAQRTTYANDWAQPRSLLAVTRAAEARGSKGPEEWLPPERGYRCRYVADWIVVKYTWQLGMDECEWAAVEAILNACEPS
jgi:hypothetical protein